MSNTRNKKIILLASTGLVTLSTMAVVLLGQNDLELMPSKATANTSRVVTINKDNRILDFYSNGYQYFTGVLFPLSDGSAYNYIYLSQSQKGTFEDNKCVLTLWSNDSSQRTCFIYMNSYINSDKVFSKDEASTQVYDRVTFNHLTAIDITLEKASDRLTELSSTVGGVLTGTFTTVAEGSNYVKKHWVPNNSKGYATNDEEVRFFVEGVEGGYPGKGVWVTEMSFYYDC